MKIAVLALLLCLSRAWLSSVTETSASLNDIETSAGNMYAAATLDFSVQSTGFSPKVTPTQIATSTTTLTNDGGLDFEYNAKVENASGTLCSFLELKDDLTDEFHPLTGFVSATTTFATTSQMLFTAQLTSDSRDLRTQRCEFTFVFDGAQLEGAGFNDREEVSQTITAGQWGPNVVINKAYYDVDDRHGEDPTNEWIELYNPTDQPVSVKNWEICDDNDCSVIIPDVSVPSLGYAFVSYNSSTWQYWNIPADVVKIYQLGGHSIALDNDADMLVLEDFDNNIIDQMNWGAVNNGWPNYNDKLWNPGVPDIAEGHMLGRVPSGYDTDQPSDFRDLGLPTVSVIFPNGGETLYVGRTYTLQWTATNPNGPATDLKIDIYYSRDSGQTWANIASSTENDGAYDWRAPLYINGYYVPSHRGRIKVVAIGPENFMVYDWDVSDGDFCPPIDYDLLTPEELEMLGQIEGGEMFVADPDQESGGSEPSSALQTSVLEASTTAVETATTTPEVATTTIETATTTPETTTTETAATEPAAETEAETGENPAPGETGGDEGILTPPPAENQPVIQEDAVIPPVSDPENNPPPENTSGGSESSSGGSGEVASTGEISGE